MSKNNADSNEKKMNKADECINCFKCTKGCPIILTGYDNPKEFISAAESENKFSINDPFKCLSCGFCKTVCPKGIDIEAIIYEHKKEWIVRHKKSSIKTDDFHKRYKVIDSHQTNSFRIPMIQAEHKDRLFFPGCALTGARFDLVMELSKDMDSHGIGLFSGCCGSPSLHVGDVVSFEEHTNKIIDELNKSKTKELIVACSNCMRAFEKIIEKANHEIQLISLYSMIGEVANHRLINDKVCNMDFVIHDPCPTRNNTGIHDDVRDLLERLNVLVAEFQYNRQNTTCCGDGGMAAVMAKDIKDTQLNKRVDEAGDRAIISYCQSCVNNFKSKGNKSVHILELIYPEIETKDNGTLIKWLNRYKLARYIKSKGE